MNSETVLITGANSGIGLELAHCFAAEGCRLILVARNRQALLETAKELEESYGVETESIAIDLAQPDAAEDIHRHLCSVAARVAILVNNAGLGAWGHFVDLDLDKQQEILRVNVFAVTSLMRFFCRA